LHKEMILFVEFSYIPFNYNKIKLKKGNKNEDVVLYRNL